MHMLVDPSSLLRECLLPMLGCLGLEKHTGEVSVPPGGKQIHLWEVPGPQNSLDDGWVERPF